MENKSLIGIKTIGVLFCILGLCILVLCFFAINSGIKLETMVDKQHSDPFNLGSLAIIEIGMLFMAALIFAGPCFVCAVGLFKLKEKARLFARGWAIFLFLPNSIYLIVGMATGHYRNLLGSVLGLILLIVILYFLSLPKIKEQFK